MIHSIKHNLSENIERFFVVVVISSYCDLLEAWNQITLVCWKYHPKLFYFDQVFVLGCSGCADSLLYI